ncbi:heavy metal translocating P-type ATPase [Poriferisphaera sp. WC338]|uniref:heavy metal translocating P-type ATPase n=1 Tax=Poriferisphaera sp. WC338 TaxID=3425129 RepID=UPI003D814BE7
MSEKCQLELQVLLPDEPDEGDRCTQRLLEAVRGSSGVMAAHLISGDEHEGGKLCLHYDPNRIDLSRLRDLVVQSGADITKRYGHVIERVRGVRHERHARTIEVGLNRVNGILEASVNSDGLVRVEFDRTMIKQEQIEAAMVQHELEVEETIYPRGEKVSEKVTQDEDKVRAPHEHKHDHGGSCGGEEHSHGGILGEKSELIYAILSGVLFFMGVLLVWLTAAPGWVTTTVFAGTYYFGGWYTLKDAVASIRVGRFEIDFLMLVAAAGAAYLGLVEEGAFLLFLFSLGHALEHYALGRARRAIKSLTELAPKTATVLRNGKEETVGIESIKICDTVVVRPDERIAVDGFVIKGNTSVDQAAITGESLPVEKNPVEEADAAVEDPDVVDRSHRVFAGTINGAGAIEVMTTRGVEDTTLARLVRLVTEAETLKSPTQKLTSAFERYYVPAVIIFVILLLFAWVILPEDFNESLYRAIAVLVAASPCALAIATPSAVLSGIASAAKGGVLMKGGGPLEVMGSVEAIAFDKTGTLTVGKPQLTDVVAADGVDEKKLLNAAIAIEKQSNHPLASAIVRDGLERLGSELPENATEVQSVTGKGVIGQYAGTQVLVGKAEMMSGKLDNGDVGQMNQMVEQLSGQGRTTMVVVQEEQLLGVLGVMDIPREKAEQAVKDLRAAGVKQQIMITGDNQRVADAVAESVGLDEAKGDLLPEDKLNYVRELKDKYVIAMVGDGVNDAPAMATASVGIAMGAAGSDVALETAEVALMSDKLEMLPFAIRLGRGAKNIIKQNLWISLGMVGVLIPSTLFGLSIGPAVVLHEGSTVLVVFNALRLLRIRSK